MRKRYLFWSGLALLAILLTLVVWQVSFSFGEYGPADAPQTFVFWAVSTLIFLLTITLGFMLFRTGVKLYLERQANREGSRIKTKLLAGALALSLLPVVFLGLFSYVILNRNVEKWFSRPAEGIRTDLVQSSRALSAEVQGRANIMARWVASLPEVDADGVNYAVLCRENNIASLEIRRPGRLRTWYVRCSPEPPTSISPPLQCAMEHWFWRSASAIDMQKTQSEIDRYMAEYSQLAAQKKNIRTMYLLFILADHAVHPVLRHLDGALSRGRSARPSPRCCAAGEVRKGNLGYRVHARAIDELATLVSAFNEMMQELEANSRELESRRRFTEAILESIPTGVISLNVGWPHPARQSRAARNFSEEQVERAAHLSDLFSREDTAEIRYLMNRARRTGVAASQIECNSERHVLHLAVTVSALDAAAGGSGFRLGAGRHQRIAARPESRRLARSGPPHRARNQESADAHRAVRRAHRAQSGSHGERPGRRRNRSASCGNVRATIAREVESVKALVDEFSQFSRFPAAQPVPSDIERNRSRMRSRFSGPLGWHRSARRSGPRIFPR